jgi:DNA-directed RNA polymerase subunit M/transcription elongation factor TFIIS
LRQIQYVSKYIALSQEGLVSKLECPIDQGLLMPNMDNEDNTYLYCLSCNYKKEIGLVLFESIKKEVDKNNV